MRSNLVLLVLTCLTFTVITGCPWKPQDNSPTFTSAGLFNPTRDIAYDASPGGEDTEHEEEPSPDRNRELVEPDVIRRYGDLLFVLNQYRGLTIADLNSKTLLSQTPTYGYPRDLYLVGDRAYVLVSYARDIEIKDDLITVMYGSKLYVFNVQDPENVVQEGSFSFAGDLIDSRMVGDVIYAVCSEYTWYDCCQDGPVETDSVAKSYGSTGAVSLNIADPDNIRIVDSVVFEGYGNLIQATNYAIFSVSTDYNTGESVITYIDITDPEGRIVVRDNVRAIGIMADRFKMDAWNGVLRIVTNTWNPDRQTYIMTYDITNPDDLVLLGSTHLANASGETTYATRFDGPRAYIVTYLTVDPLFVVDLSDPTAPQVLGELKIPGWSTHIEPRGDRLIALGVDDENGRRVMVSLFDVSDPSDPKRLDYASFGEGWSWSSAYTDVKSFTVLDDMILVPFSGWNSEKGGGYDRLQFVAYTRNTLDVQGYVDLQGSVVRSFAYADHYCAVTQEQLAFINADDPASPSIDHSMTLAENVVDVLPLEANWTVEVIARNDQADTLLRAVNYEDNEVGGSVSLSESSVVDIFKWNNSLVLVAQVFEESPNFRAFYRVYLIDFSDAATPVITNNWNVSIEPWWNYWGGPYPVDWVVVGAQEKRMYRPWYYYHPGTTAFLLGDYIVLHGTAQTYDVIVGDKTPAQGLAVLDLLAPDSIRYVGLGLENIQDINSSQNLLYITTCREIRNANDQRTYCAYYLQTFDPFDLRLGNAINVPGIFLNRIQEGGYVLLKDIQYRDNSWNTLTILRSITLSETEATLISSFALDEGNYSFVVDANDIYFSGVTFRAQPYDYVSANTSPPSSGTASSTAKQSDEGVYKVARISVSSGGEFGEPVYRRVSTSWCSLLGAHNEKSYVVVESVALAQYDFSQKPPALSQVVPLMGYPSKIRYRASTAYVPLGYSGLLILD